MLSIKECAEIIAADESDHGPDGVWNSLFRLQEVVYRAQKSRKILWLMRAVSDWVQTERMAVDSISVSKLKSGSGSISDVALMQLDMRDYLLGAWLDGLNVPAHMKAKCREIFDSRSSYRCHYMPATGVAATTWLFKWPPFGRLLINFLESILYNPTGNEEFMLRQAVKNSNSPEEVISWKPWNTMIGNLRDGMARSTDPPAPPKGGGTEAATSNADVDVDSDAEEQAAFNADGQGEVQPGRQDGHTVPKGVTEAASRLQRQLLQFVVEPPTQSSLAELLKACPLATIEPNLGNTFLVVMDCNCWGEADTQPNHRVAPIGTDIFKKYMKSIRTAREGPDCDNTPLKKGDLYICFNAAKDRKRLFSKPLHCSDKVGKDPARTLTQSVLVHMTEDSWRARRGRHSGRSKLTQHAYICATASTLRAIPKCEFATHAGSTKSDVCGPVILDAKQDLPMLSHSDKVAYHGKRRTGAGGCKDDSDADASEDEEAAEGECDGDEVKYPICYHVLPIDLLLDFIKAFQVRHIVDFSPTPMPLTVQLANLGITYLAICGTEEQKNYLHDKSLKDLENEMMKVDSALYDPRMHPNAKPLVEATGNVTPMGGDGGVEVVAAAEAADLEDDAPEGNDEEELDSGHCRLATIIVF